MTIEAHVPDRDRGDTQVGDAAEDRNAGDDRSRRAGTPGQPGVWASLLRRMRPRMPRVMREDLTEALMHQGSGEDAFSPAERAMLNNILRLREVRVEDVMVPRADIEAAEIGTTLGELMRQFEASGHSRMPVYGESLDDPRGMIHIRDVVAHITRVARPARPGGTAAGGGNGSRKPKSGLDLRQIDLAKKIEDLGIIRKVLFVPPSMLASDLMARMQATRTQMALVIDEYGGTDGLVSLEDVIEMVVGNIEDEHDDEAPMITAGGDGIWVADARADLDEVKALVGEDFDISEYEEEADTIGGLLFSELGRVPTRGEVIQAVPGFEFQVLDADPRRVRRVRIVRFRQGDKRRRVVEGLANAP
ncbi:MAG: hemolysin family protein [Aurantimonas endophytica]|uniref:CBS domain containing-hemolysin-like protein n=1 Tax=Aurantimonas endophytica TaxID=1522175 RepID=A0A7W6MRT0_9HYPH|nr:hemolysin family protein [Aurantimonas endophytica]MBB4005314.1 CBS domain containing-hemolysin-like protein [Aurantimonas endophytica]